MCKIWFGLVFAAVIAGPVSAQDYHRNFVDCATELGLYRDTAYTHRLQPDAGGRVLRRWYFHSEAQQATFNDCVARKARLGRTPSAKGAQRAAQ
jgi:hypothetical protein